MFVYVVDGVCLKNVLVGKRWSSQSNIVRLLDIKNLPAKYLTPKNEK